MLAGLNDPSVARMLMVLGFIIGLILVLAYLYRKVVLMRGGSVMSAKILMTLPLGTRERVVLIEMEGKRLLLGVTTQSIAVLQTFPEAKT